MAHDQKRKRQADENLNLPLRLGAMIRPIGDAVCVGDWVVGYQPPGDEHGWIPDQWYDFGGSPPQDWLSAMVVHTRSHQPHAEVVRRFLTRNGTFREWDWVTAEKAFQSGIPDEVKKEIRRSKVSAKEEVYLLQVDQFYREWHLLEFLALIAGKLAGKSSALRVRPEAKIGKQLLDEVQKHDHLPLPKRQPGFPSADLFPEVKQSDTQDREPSSAYARVPLAKQAGLVITSLIGSAFSRAIRNRQYSFFWPRMETGPRIGLKVRSILGIAYLALLANFSRGWKRCERQDCGNIFPVTDDKRKVYCSQYCGHLESVRRNRRDAHKRKLRAKRKGGKS